MKILFVNPCLRHDAPHRYIPVGLGYIVTSVQEAGYDFDILDIDIGGHSDEEVEEYILSHDYDVVALGAIVTHYKWVKWFVKMTKNHIPDCKIIVGNSVGGSIPEIIFANTPIDIAVIGEGDITTVDVLDALRDNKSLGQAIEPEIPVAHKHGNNIRPCVQGKGIEGIVFRDGQNRFVHNGLRKAAKQIDDFSFPNWDLFDVESYIKRATMMANITRYYPVEDAVILPVSTARGCVFKCTFCHYVFWHDPYRHRSPESVIGELTQNKEKYGVNYVNFWDELSFHKLGPAEKFVDELLKADLKIHWGGAIRVDLFGREDIPYEDRLRVAQKFYDAGCVTLGFSLESGNDEILEAMNKRVKASYFKEQVEILRKVGISTNTSVVIGYPQETAATIADTMNMCENTGVYPSVGFLLPLPETGMWAYAIENNLITDPDDFLTTVTERQDVILNMTSMSTEDLVEEVTNGLAYLSEKFEINLNKDTLIKTGGYKKHGVNQGRKIEANRNTENSLNYSKVSGVL